MALLQQKTEALQVAFHKVSEQMYAAAQQQATPGGNGGPTDGAADGELSLRRARQAFEDIEFHPSILRDVSHVDTTARILGGGSALPFGIAPTGFTRLMQTEGEVAGAGAAVEAEAEAEAVVRRPVCGQLNHLARRMRSLARLSFSWGDRLWEGQLRCPTCSRHA